MGPPTLLSGQGHLGRAQPRENCECSGILQTRMMQMCDEQVQSAVCVQVVSCWTRGCPFMRENEAKRRLPSASAATSRLSTKCYSTRGNPERPDHLWMCQHCPRSLEHREPCRRVLIRCRCIWRVGVCLCSTPLYIRCRRPRLRGTLERKEVQ